MKRLFLFLLTAVCLFGQSQNVTVIPSPGSGGMNTGTFSTQGINYYLGKTGTTWDFSQVTLILPNSLAFVSSITAGAGINVSQSTGAVTISNTGVLAITPGSGITESIVGGTVTLNNSGVLAITAGNGISVSGTQANITINATSSSSGTVTSVSAVGQNGIGAVVTTPNTTPVITLNLGAITPSSVTTGGLATVGSLRTSNLTGYLYGNGASNVTASTTIPAASVSGLATVATTGNYNDLIGKPTLNAGTVTSVAGTGSVNGITLTGNVTSSGSLTLGGTLSGISNSQLTNNSITVTAGNGLSGGGSVALGGSTTLTNAGVTNIVAGTGITVNAATGSVTINSTATGGVSSIAGTTNQVIASASTGAVTLSLPQSIATSSTPQFARMGLGIGADPGVGLLDYFQPTAGGQDGLEVVGFWNVSGNNQSYTNGYFQSGVFDGSYTGITYYNVFLGHGSMTGTAPANSYQLYIEALIAGTNKYAIYQAGTGDTNFFAGPTSVPSLTVTGNTGYMYANGSSQVTASSTIPTTALSGTITNAQLTNNSITVTAGTGLSGGGTVALGGTITLTSTASGGTVTTVSVSPNSGVTAGVTNPTTTPAISIGLGNITPTSVSTGALTATGTTTLATSLSGVLKSTSGVVSVATANTDYLPATTGNSSQLLGSNGSGGLSNISVGSGLTLSGGVLTSSGGGGGVTTIANGGTGATTANGAVVNLQPGSLAVTESSGAITLNWAAAPIQRTVLNANATVSFSNANEGQSITAWFTNNSTSYTVSWPSVYWAGSSIPVMTPSSTDSYKLTYINGNYYGQAIQNYTNVLAVTYLIVGGGGSGGNGTPGVCWGGGGGGGGLQSGTANEALGTTYTIVVGSGGTGSATAGVTNSGTSSSAFGITAGGGVGGNAYSTAYGGNSGSPQNNLGALQGVNPGGGGAGAGGNASGTNGSNGLTNSITGTSLYYAGGGGSGGDATIGSGGLGGGGTGAKSLGTPTSGSANTGGGGGGKRGDDAPAAGSGGSGVVIISSLRTAASTTGSPTVTTSGSYTIYTFTGGGTITF